MRWLCHRKSTSLSRGVFSQSPVKSKPCAWLVNVFPARPGQIVLNTLGHTRLQRTGLRPIGWVIHNKSQQHEYRWYSWYNPYNDDTIRDRWHESPNIFFIGNRPRLHKMLGSVTLLEHEPELHDIDHLFIIRIHADSSAWFCFASRWCWKLVFRRALMGCFARSTPLEVMHEARKLSRMFLDSVCTSNTVSVCNRVYP